MAADALRARWPELLVGTSFGMVGWYWTRVRTRFRIGRRIANELVETQTALRNRAFPTGGWREGDPRYDWMLEPYVRRIDFLSDLALAEGLRPSVNDALNVYQHRVEDFIREWSTAARRRDVFRSAYSDSHIALEDALRKLLRYRGRRERMRALSLDPESREASSQPDA